MDVVDKFYARTSGQRIGSCGGIFGECVAGSQNYTNNELQIGGCPAFPVAYAKQMMGSRDDAFISVYNTPDGVAPRGSIVVFNGNTGGGAGHTGVVVTANRNTLDVYQQNDPYGSGMHVKTYNYNNVTGWMIPKGWIGTPAKGDDKMTPEQHKAAYRIILGREAEAGAGNGGLTAWEFIQNAQGELNAQRAATTQRITDLTNRVTQLEKVVTDAQKVVTSQQKQLEAAGADKATLTKQVEALNKKIDDLSQQQSGLDNYSLGELLSAAFSKLFKVK